MSDHNSISTRRIVWPFEMLFYSYDDRVERLMICSVVLLPLLPSRSLFAMFVFVRFHRATTAKRVEEEKKNGLLVEFRVCVTQ